jgi:DNA-3-methyladenine glycosylase
MFMNIDLTQSAVTVAQNLLGHRLYTVAPDGTKVGGEIIETEAYNQDDAASHSYRGKTPRTEVMFGPAGHMYVYFTYGMHWCMNIVTGEEERGEAVLIRAIQPDEGIEIMRKRRNNRPNDELTNGPAKVCQALDVTGKDNGVKLNEGRFILLPPTEKLDYIATERIGITKDTHRLWRFVAK